MVRSWLIEKRKAKNLNRKELAGLLNVSSSMVEKVEKGERNASVNLARKWAVILEIDDIMNNFFDNQSDNMSGELKRDFITA